MIKLNRILLMFSLIMTFSLISASTYSIEFTQVGDKIVVKEIINGIEQESYVDNDILNIQGSNIYFIKKIIFPANFTESLIKLNLDSGVIVNDDEIFPADYKVETDGKIISISWYTYNVSTQKNLALYVSLLDTKKVMTLPEVILRILAGLFILVMMVIVYRAIKNKRITSKPEKRENKPIKKEIKKDVYDYLLDTEKKVIEELKKADRNELWQKQIQNTTGFSKAKVSRLIRNLEARGLIVKIPFGNTNKIRLK